MEKQQLNINANVEDLKGRYANLMLVSHNKEEFLLDYLLTEPQGTHFLARIVTSPGHLKRISRVLEEQLKAYEGQFGPIMEAEEPQGKIGFTPK